MILDFGLIAELLPQHAGDVSDAQRRHARLHGARGRVRARAPSEAGDWYGVGVTLYEALTGSRPFAGPVLDVLRRKRTTDPPSPAQLGPDVPADLSAICMGLLRRNPAQRLSGQRRFAGWLRDTTPAVSETAPRRSATRRSSAASASFRSLNDAFAAVVNGGAAAVSVYGPSGIGKSALVRRFLGQFGDARRRRRPLRSLLRERVGAVQGARRRRRRPEPLSRVASAPSRSRV